MKTQKLENNVNKNNSMDTLSGKIERDCTRKDLNMA